jgi:hypothetical protein
VNSLPQTILRRCDRNRQRSKRKGGRCIRCQEDNCIMQSASRKYPLFANDAVHLRERGVSQRKANLIIQQHQSVPLQDEWLESFWCPACDQKDWFHIKKIKGVFEAGPVTPEMWKCAAGAIPLGNPSVSEFSQRESKRLINRNLS